MLPKNNRLSKPKDFDRVFKKTKPVFSEHLSLRCSLNNAESRIGFVVSNKVDKRSVRRNALKRQLRTIAQELLPNIAPANIVLIVKKDFDFPYDQKVIKSELSDLLRRAKLLK